MGKGGYLGGSTIIYPGGRWSSDQPNFSGRASSYKAAPSPEKKAGSKNKIKEDARDFANIFEAQRIVYLHGIIDAFIKKASSFPAAPKKARHLLATQVAKAGGEMNWARIQPEFLKLAEKKRKRHEKKILQTGASGTFTTAAKDRMQSGEGARSHTQVQALLAKKAELEQALQEINRKLLEIRTFSPASMSI